MAYLNREARRAALKARRAIKSKEPINWSAVEHQEQAFHGMEMPMLCPCCSFMWDHAEARAAFEVSPEAYRAWLWRTLALPVNELGPDLGQRGAPITLEDFE